MTPAGCLANPSSKEFVGKHSCRRALFLGARALRLLRVRRSDCRLRRIRHSGKLTLCSTTTFGLLIANQFLDGVDAVTPHEPVSKHSITAINDTTALLYNPNVGDTVFLYDASTAFQPESPGSPTATLHDVDSLLSDNHVIAFVGGASATSSLSSSVFLLDLRTWTWTESQAQTKSVTLERRWRACLCRARGRNEGSHIFWRNLREYEKLGCADDAVDSEIQASNTHRWTMCHPTGKSPKPRNSTGSETTWPCSTEGGIRARR